MPVATGLQDGIYYSHNDYARNSYSIVFLRAREEVEGARIRKTLSKLWRTYLSLQEELVSGLRIKNTYAKHSTLSVLMGYGPKFFQIKGLAKLKPKYLDDEWLFRSPSLGGGPIISNVGLKYSEEVKSNEVANDHVAIQFIGDTHLATHRAVVETWKVLRKIDIEESSAPLIMRSFYTGFNRPDGRGWLGFHDGVSNIKSTERLKQIQINKNTLDPVDYWTANGTYMAFLRISIDLAIWESIPIKEQERIVGRQKSTGCPLVRIDERDKNVFAAGCPISDTSDINERGNEQFRDYSQRPPYQKRNVNTGPGASVQKSHVGRLSNAPVRIFRQGYEFLEAIESYPYFRVGLNFVSFQRGTDRLYRSIEYGFGGTNFGGDSTSLFPGSDKLLSVFAAGLFLVPPFSRGEGFPGDIILAEENGYPKH